MSNITRQFISQIEAGKRLPSISTLSALANTYDSTLTNFFKEVDRLYPLIENGRVIVSPPEPYAAEKNTKATNYIGDIKKENEDEKGPL